MHVILSALFPSTLNSSLNTSDPESPATAQAQLECYMPGVLALMQPRNIPQEPIYLLDPKAPLPLHCEVKQDM